MRLPRIIGLAALAAGLTVSSAQAAGFRCSASAARVTVLGQAVEPVTANGAGTNCAGDAKTVTGTAAGFSGPLTLGALIASTEVIPADKTVVATGGVADLRVGSLPSLPISLPAVGIPADAKAAIANALKTSVDLTAVKAAIPVLPTDLVTTLPTTLPSFLPTDTGNPIVDAANAATNAANNALFAANAATNAANTITNAVNTATNLANTATNAIRAAIPDSVPIDGTATLDAALNALLPDGKLPTIDLLRVQGAIAYAAGTCTKGVASVAGSSNVTGIKVLGADLPVGQVVDRVLTLIDTAKIDPSVLALPSIDLGLTAQQQALIDTLPAAGTAVSAAKTAATSVLRSALDAIADVKVLDPTVAQVKVTPGTRVLDGKSVTQRALTVTVSIAGQTIVDAVIGEAKASAADVDCSNRVVDPADVTAAVPDAPGSFREDSTIPADATPEELTLGCATRKLVLVDVIERGGRVVLTGVADTSYAGKTVDIVFDATKKVVANAKVARDGSFDTTAPLPPVRLRDTNDARYRATLGSEESTNLKLRRRMIVDSMDYRGGKVTIAGHVVLPLARPIAPIALKRRVSCTKEEVVTTFRPRADGRFRVTVKAPKGVASAVYRMTTKVRVTEQGSGVFETYTLPRAVELSR